MSLRKPESGRPRLRQKSPRDADKLFRHFVNPSHLNGYGTLHGGWLLQWMDEAAAITASVLTGHTCVTRYIAEASFESTAVGGDIVEISIRLTATGKTSLTFSAEAKNRRTGKIMARIGKIVFVALDAKGKPIKTGRNHLPAV